MGCSKRGNGAVNRRHGLAPCKVTSSGEQATDMYAHQQTLSLALLSFFSVLFFSSLLPAMAFLLSFPFYFYFFFSFLFYLFFLVFSVFSVFSVFFCFFCFFLFFLFFFIFLIFGWAVADDLQGGDAERQLLQAAKLAVEAVEGLLQVAHQAQAVVAGLVGQLRQRRVHVMRQAHIWPRERKINQKK